MFRNLYQVKPQAWVLSIATMVAIVVPMIVQQFDVIDAAVSTAYVQPALAVLVAVTAGAMMRGQRDRARHKFDTGLMIGSVIAVWFVVYFASGLIVTYVHNAVALSWVTIAKNLLTFGLTAAAVEYVRYALMQQGGRRNVVWFGVLVSVLLAVQDLNVSQFQELHSASDVIKLSVSSVLPALAHSLLLTYLAITAGLGPQLTYRLGVIAIMYIPPVIPKYDWYLTGIAWLLLVVAVYVFVDRTKRESADRQRRVHHTRRATDVMFFVCMGALVLFMIGAFSYRPQAIMSNSMYPVFSRGSIVIVQKANAVDVAKGDIIQYEAHGRSVTHRVIAVDIAEDGSGSKVFFTKGDNSPSVDEPVKPDQIVGIIRAQVPYIGYPTVWLRETVK